MSMRSIIGGSGGPRSCYFYFHEYIWNSHVVVLVLPCFDDTSSLGYPSRRVGNREAELKATIFSSLLLFNVFLFF